MTDVTAVRSIRFIATVNEQAGWAVTVSVGEQSDATGSAPGDDPDANFVRAVYAEHGPALLAYATRLIGDRGQAEDVVQETLLRAWQHAEGLAADSRPLRPWLFTVAARVAVDAHRARRARWASTATRAATVNSQGRSGRESAANPSACCHARSSVSCTTSSACPRSPISRVA